MMTLRGERKLAPDFGSNDLLFLPEINVGDLLVSFARYYPDVEIDDVNIIAGQTGTNAIDINFSTTEVADEDA